MNAPAAFTRLVSDVFKELIGHCMVFYLDDVVIYSKNESEHEEHLRKFFQLLRKHKLFAKGSKCHIGQECVDFLGYKISKNGVETQERLVKAVEEWPQPKDLKDVQRFLGLAGFYRKFIRNYADICRPISDLLRSHKFVWNAEQNKAFMELKTVLC